MNSEKILPKEERLKQKEIEYHKSLMTPPYPLIFKYHQALEVAEFEIERLKSELLEKDKKIKEAFYAGGSRGWDACCECNDIGFIKGSPDWETFAKENNITI